MRDNPFSLDGKNILITGASSGIGREIAILCSKMGASVYAVARREDKLKELMSEMNSTNNGFIVADLLKKEDLDQIIDQIPKLDGVMHCAGVGSRVLAKIRYP